MQAAAHPDTAAVRPPCKAMLLTVACTALPVAPCLRDAHVQPLCRAQFLMCLPLDSAAGALAMAQHAAA